MPERQPPTFPIKLPLHYLYSLFILCAAFTFVHFVDAT